MKKASRGCRDAFLGGVSSGLYAQSGSGISRFPIVKPGSNGTSRDVQLSYSQAPAWEHTLARKLQLPPCHPVQKLPMHRSTNPGAAAPLHEDWKLELPRQGVPKLELGNEKTRSGEAEEGGKRTIKKLHMALS